MALGVSLPALFRASAAEGPAPCLFLSGDSRLPGTCGPRLVYRRVLQRSRLNRMCAHRERLAHAVVETQVRIRGTGQQTPAQGGAAGRAPSPSAGRVPSCLVGGGGQSLFDPSLRLVGGGPPTSWKATCLLRVPSQQLQALRPGPLALLCRPFPSLSPNPVTKGRKGR